MNCCRSNGPHGKPSQNHINSDNEKKHSWIFWVVVIIILALIVLSIFR